MWKTRALYIGFYNGRRSFSISASRCASIDEAAVAHQVQVKEIPQITPTGLQASHKRGTGGRSSFSGNIVTVFGASGVMGPHMINRLGKEGAQIVVPYRRTGYSVKHLRPSADLGQMLFFHFHLEDEDSIRKAMKHSNVVINMIGQDYETWNFKWDDVHVRGARRLARIAREMGVQRFIHFSALNCNPDPAENIIPGGSGFLRSKYYGELAVREEFPNATIIRPAEIYCEQPSMYFETWMWWFRRHSTNKLNLFQRGDNTYKMPLWLGDLLDGFMRIYRDPTLDGQTYEFAGPYAYKLGEIVDWLYRKCNRGEIAYYQRRHMSGYLALHTNLVELRTWVMKRRPAWTWDMLERREATTDVLTGMPTLEDLGITNLMVFDIRAPFLIERYDRLSYMILERGEFPEPPPPTRYPQIRKKPDSDEPDVQLDHGEVQQPTDHTRRMVATT